MRSTEHTTRRNRGWLKTSAEGVVLLVLSALVFPSVSLAATARIKLPTHTLEQQGIDLAALRSSTFVQLKSVPAFMTLSEDAEPDARLDLSAVQFSGAPAHGVWLRSRCDAGADGFALEECRGTACLQTRAETTHAKNPHTLWFRGEAGAYKLTGHEFAAQLKRKISPRGAMCGRTWPAWAVSARARSAEQPLSFPHNLLALQTDEKIYLVNGISGKIWNAIYWNASDGIFNHISVSDDGRMLFRNNASQALYFDFAAQQYLALNGNRISSSFAGLNALFAGKVTERSDRSVDLLDSGAGAAPVVNLGGLWMTSGYLNWDDLAFALRAGKSPMPRAYPNAGRLISAVWSPEADAELTLVLLREQDKFRLFGRSDSKSSLKSYKTFAAEGEATAILHYTVHPDFIARINPEGLTFINSGSGFVQDQKLIHEPQVGQNGIGMITHHQHKSPEGKCRVSYYTPRRPAHGWSEALVLPNTPCSTGIGRSSAGAALLEMTSSHFVIHLISSAD